MIKKEPIRWRGPVRRVIGRRSDSLSEGSEIRFGDLPLVKHSWPNNQRQTSKNMRADMHIQDIETGG